MTLRQVAREAATGAQATAPVDECHAIADAVAQAALQTVEGTLRRHGTWPHGADPVTRARARGWREAADAVRDLRASLASEPVTMWEAKP